MFKKAIASVIVGGALAGGLIAGTGTANATGSYLVCDAIDRAPTYESYLIDAVVWGYAFNWDASAQAYNIVSAVATYCPWHMSGIQSAAAVLS
jgi:hypothetical protein